MSDPNAPAAPGDEVPIFTLGTVLFPRGVLPLRVFETRYVDMVRERLRAGAPFGVCRITRGSEVGSAAKHEPVGCLAHIVDWDMPQPGVLSIRAVGGDRFRVIQSRVDNGLVRARVAPLPADERIAPPEALSASVALLRQAIDALSEAGAEGAPSPIEPPHELDSAGWVANRLAELLPLPAETRQQLMALDDPLQRLARVDALLRAMRAS